MCGTTPGEVVEDFSALVGRAPLPPLWSLGFHQSRWSYGSAQQVRDLVAEFRNRQIPLDVVHLDIDYMDGYRVFTWDRREFPDPAGCCVI
jgi:alpha-glucosidase